MDSYRLFLEYFGQNKGFVLANLVLIMFNYPLEIIVLSYLSSRIFVQLGDLEGNWRRVVSLLSILIGCYVLLEVSISLKDYLDSKQVPQFEEFVRNRIINLVFDKNETNCDNVQMGELIQRLMKIPPSLSDVYERLNKYVVPFFLTVISVTGYLFYVNSGLGVLVSVGFAVYFAIYAYMSFRQVEYSQKRQKDETLLYEDIDDTLGNVFTILGHNQLPFEKGLLEGRSRRFNSVFESEMIENARLKFIASLMNVALFVLFISFALSLYRNRGIDQATAIGLLTMIMFLVKHIRGLARRVSEGLVSLGNLREGDVYLRRLSSVGKRGWKRDVIKTGRIRFEGVNFRYPDNRTDSLRDVTFEISPGENVVVIGKSGSGKSTVLKLLMGFYQVYRGRISIDSTDVRTIDPGHLRSNIKYLGQNVRLFNRPIIDNIIYGTGVDREKAKRVVNSLKVGRVLSSRNLEELAGKFGDNLSGGQKQMVQLIRSYLDRSRLVLLDEPTSAIDPHHKRDVVRVIRHLMSTRQVVLVTHDWSLIGMFPRVIYMDRGRVLYDGPTSGFSPPRDGGA